jgi:hypothetical protein
MQEKYARNRKFFHSEVRYGDRRSTLWRSARSALVGAFSFELNFESPRGAEDGGRDFRGVWAISRPRRAARRCPVILVLRLAFRRRAPAMLAVPSFALLSSPLLLLLRCHHAPNLPPYILPYHFQLLLLRLLTQRRILPQCRDLRLAIVANRLDLRLLLVRQIQRRVIFRRVRAHRSRTAATLRRSSSRASRMRRRRTTALLRARYAQPCQAERQTANHHHTSNRFHKTPFRILSNHRVYQSHFATAILPPMSTNVPSHQPRHIDVRAFPAPSLLAGKNH